MVTMLASTRGSSSSTEITARGGWEASGWDGDELRVRLFGEWVLASGARSSAELSRRLSQIPSPTRISFDARELGAWDSVLINFLSKLEAQAGERGIAVDRSGLPGGVQRLVGLARAVPERQGARRIQQQPDLLTRIGQSSLGFLRQQPILSPSSERRSSGSAGCSSAGRASEARI
jgi:hypothetical protein